MIITKKSYNSAIDQAYVLGVLNVSKSVDVVSDEMDRLTKLGMTSHSLLEKIWKSSEITRTYLKSIGGNNAE